MSSVTPKQIQLGGSQTRGFSSRNDGIEAVLKQYDIKFDFQEMLQEAYMFTYGKQKS